MDKVSISTLQKYKQEGQKFVALTAYDASFAHAFNRAGVPVLLVGDSLGMVLQGHTDTLKVTVAEVAYHTRAVAAGAPQAWIIADLPFMSYHTTERACDNAAKLMQAGAHMVKLEGGDWLLDTVTALTERSVPVCAHLGLTPQSVHQLGGYKVQGRGDNGQAILAQAERLQAAGAALLVLECVPRALAERISQTLTIPVIGIGAGAGTDGQILVMHDLLGLSLKRPKFAKNYLQVHGDINAAIQAFITEVRHGDFPTMQHSFE